jgi:hypothetical protein
MRHKMTKVGTLAGTLALFAAGAFAYPQNLATLTAMQLYDVQEMLAALLLFSIGFAVIAVVVMILFLLDRGLYVCWLRRDPTRPGGAVAAPRSGAGRAGKDRFPIMPALVAVPNRESRLTLIALKLETRAIRPCGVEGQGYIL